MADNLGVTPPGLPRDLEFDSPQMQARVIVKNYVEQRLEVTDGTEFNLSNVYVVWFTFVLGSWKCLISTTLPDGMYYEVTHNKTKGETYLDAYKKFDNVKFVL